MRDGNRKEDSKSRDFLGALDELNDLTPTDQIAEHVGCSIKDAVVSKPMGDKRLVCARKTK